jgi:hypothetical protein
LIVAVPGVVIGWIVAANVAAFKPAGTVTLAGTETKLWGELSVTIRPPAGAAAERLIVPLIGLAAVTDDEAKETPVSLDFGTSTIKDAEAVKPIGSEPEISAWLFAATG